MKKFKTFLLGVIVIIIFVLLVGIFSLFDLGLKWEQLSSDYLVLNHVTLVLFRVLTYGLPGLVLLWVGKSKFFSIGYTIVDMYTIQFTAYAVIKMGWEFLGLSYIWSVDMLEYISTSVIVVSLLLTLILKRKVKISNDII